MRAVVVVVVIALGGQALHAESVSRATVAEAARRRAQQTSREELIAADDTVALGWIALTTGDAREAALGALVALGVLDRDTRALVPTRAAIARALARQRDARARRLLVPATCFVRAASRDGVVVTC